MRRLVPKLDAYERQERIDAMSDQDKEVIDEFFRRHVAISPNKKDVRKRRHPIYPRQVEEKQAMHRYETFNELWIKFKEENKLWQTDLKTSTAHTNARWYYARMLLGRW